ncbi:nardilysin-like protein, partial [Reticulomyxa filosa]
KTEKEEEDEEEEEEEEEEDGDDGDDDDDNNEEKEAVATATAKETTSAAVAAPSSSSSSLSGQSEDQSENSSENDADEERTTEKEDYAIGALLGTMIFMGNAKYPTENEYDAFLQENSGSSNAYTESIYTIFYHELAPKGLKLLLESLDRLASNFISPLFKQDSIDRELNAIENEFQLTKTVTFAQATSHKGAHFERPSHGSIRVF